MNLLHYVEGDGDDAASVLTHSHTPGRVIQKHKLNMKSFICSKPIPCIQDHIYVLFEKHKKDCVYS